MVETHFSSDGYHRCVTMGVGRGAGRGLGPPLILKLLAKKVVFSISRGKNKLHHYWPPPGKNLGKIPYCPPPGKNPSDAHVCNIINT